MPRAYLAVAAAYAVLCLALWPLPLFGLLHVEASAVVAGVGFFASGLGALARLRAGASLRGVLVRLVALLAVPLALLTLSLLWRPNCGYGQGLGLFLLLTVPSVVLAVALAYALAPGRRPRLVFVLVGLAAATLPVLWDLGLHPQFYTYNHVWGGVLGPIYDEELAVRPGLFWFRGVTLLWAAALWLVGRRAEERRNGSADEERAGRERREGRERKGNAGWSASLSSSPSRPTALALLAVLVLIGLAYAFAPRLGFNTPGWLIRERLGGHYAGDRFDLYYDPESLSEGEVRVVADAHAYRYHRLRAALGVDVEERIATYLYPDAATKAALTGAGLTSVAPVWLPRPQIHLLESRFAASFGHELVHVFSREFGGLLRASPAVGLVEGLAVAFEPPDGLPPVDARVAAAARYRSPDRPGEAGALVEPLAEAVAARLGPLGFWTGRGAVSYTTMGSFVRWLYRSYGAEPLRAVYASGDFERAYGLSLDTLAARWQADVLALPADAEAEALVAQVFTRPSLFEQRCPHWVEPWKRAYRAGLGALAAGETEAAEAHFEKALVDVPTQPSVLSAWGRLALARGEVARVRERLREVVEADTLAGALVWSRLGDAHALAGDAASADSAYVRALGATPTYARTARAALAVRRRASPGVLAVLLGTEPERARADRLEAEGAPEARVLAALLRAEEGDWAGAQHALESVPPRAIPGIEPERWAWLARFAHAAGDRPVARVYAERAARAFQAAGAGHAAAELRDHADELAWVLFREARGRIPKAP